MNFTRVFCGLIAAAFLLTGCETMGGYWKDTKRFYGEYINPPATLDLDGSGKSLPEEARLANAFSEMDAQLMALERAFDSCPMPPSGEWVGQILDRFPWLSGIAALSATGEILDQLPKVAVKPLDFLPLMDVPEGRKRTELRSYVQDTPLGPEIYLGLPIYSGSEFMGILVTHFDFRSVLSYSRSQDDMVVTAPEVMLWPGRYGTNTPMAGADWNDILRSRYYGTLGSGDERFYWVVRYFANQPLIFGVPVNESYMAPAEAAVEAPAQ